MTLFFNVSDAIGDSPNHGITRTERKLASSLLTEPDVRFVTVVGNDFFEVDASAVADRLQRVDRASEPVAERFGITAPPAPLPPRRRLSKAGRRWVAGQRREPGAPAALEVRLADVDRADVVVSVGLDWIRGVPAAAERIVLGRGARFVGCCYDTIPIDHPEWMFPPEPARFMSHFRRLTAVADQMLAISECTKRDFCRLFPAFGGDRVDVLRLGADAAVAAGTRERAFAASLFDGEPYAIYTATVDRRKNHHVLYRAMRELVRRDVAMNVLFVGRMGNGVGDLIDALRYDESVAGRFTHVADCDDRHLAALYERAAFAVYPSLYEGWGLGVTEALAHGKACVVASGSSLSEAGLGLCRELHPLKTGEWVEAIAEYAESPPVLRPFELPTWSDAAASLVSVVQERLS